MQRWLICFVGLMACDVPGGALSLDASDLPLDGGDSDAREQPDVGVDAPVFDAGERDASFDAGSDAELDAGADPDSGSDAGMEPDVGPDACEPIDECNGLDDDCDGFTDEDGCEGCTRVEAAGVPSHVYLFCDDTQRDWDEGETWCDALGYRLADVQTELEHSFVWMRAQSIRDDHWWIGLRSTDAWRWTRGEAAHPSDEGAYNGWISGNPSDSEECARMKKDADGVDATFSDGGWETKQCTDGNFVICEVGG